MRAIFSLTNSEPFRLLLLTLILLLLSFIGSFFVRCGIRPSTTIAHKKSPGLSFPVVPVNHTEYNHSRELIHITFSELLR